MQLHAHWRNMKDKVGLVKQRFVDGTVRQGLHVRVNCPRWEEI